MTRDLSKLRINLDKAVVLLIDESATGLGLLNTIVSGFGIGERMRANSARDAIDILKEKTVDLILFEDTETQGMDGFDFVKWLRRSGLRPNAFVPTILVTGHTPRAKVEKARDCGASYIVTKPLTPLALLERIVFVSKDPRPFVECDSYIGPDRRFKNVGPPPGVTGRRKTDLQDDLVTSPADNAADAQLKPTKVSP
jgi:CheY-like chemotaxis protein